MMWSVFVGEHHSNGLSRAKAAGQQIVKVVDLGDDFAMAGVQLLPVYTDETKDTLAFVVSVMAGRNSPLVGLQVVPTIVSEVGRISVAELKASISKALSPKVEETA
jgi:hypothetical protein